MSPSKNQSNKVSKKHPKANYPNFRFNKTPVVYKNPNWKYYLKINRSKIGIPNVILFLNSDSNTIWYNRNNNNSNSNSNHNWSNNRINRNKKRIEKFRSLPFYLIHPKTGKRKYVKNVYKNYHLNKYNNLRGFLEHRNKNLNTWNAFLKRSW